MHARAILGCNPGTLIEIGYALKRRRPLAVLGGWAISDEAAQPVAGMVVARTAAEAVALVLGPDVGGTSFGQ